ncbi:YceI family protein [Nakamurella sp.]|uniref:YceI family protein n=1 Tax=Nakamurella sp. TaxID=1869182 RepID=UPI003B3ADF03
MSAGLQARERLAGVWTVVPETARAAFRVRDKLVGHAAGTIPVRSGTVHLASGGDVLSARLELDAAAIDTGNVRRDRDLRKPHFLAAADHPAIVVEAGPAPFDGSGWTLRATLAARGAVAPVELTVTLDPAADAGSAAGAGPVVGVRVTGRLDRAPLGMRVPAVVVGRIVELDVHLSFHR